MSDPKKDPRAPIIPPGKPPPPPPDSPPPDEEPTQDDSDHEEPRPVAVAIETRRLAVSSDPDMPWLRDVDLELLRTLPARRDRDESLYGTVMLAL